MTRRLALQSRLVLLALGALCVAGAPAAAKDVQRKEPGPRSTGQVYEWTSKNGIAFQYRVPKDYDPERGAGLTYVLHGSNLDRRWGFANHSAETFRPDDVVVCPDGTTSNGNGGFNSLGRPEDAKRFHAFDEEIKATFKVTATYLYGHSQGSFFAFYYAGEYPDDVQGVVGHASGVWTQTRLSKKGHHQAIVLMHGTQDPVVPYVQSAGGYSSYVEAGYPLVRLRSLEGWNHWPAEHNGPVPHTSQQLAWVEGMTTTDPRRLEACWGVLGKVADPDQHDYAGTWSLATRLAKLDGCPPKVAKEAATAATALEALVQGHLDDMALPKELDLEAPEAAARFVYFMRRFDGIPACDQAVEGRAKELTAHQKGGVQNLRKYFAALQSGDEAAAFAHGIEAVQKGFLWPECHDRAFREKLAALRKEAKRLKVRKPVLAAYDKLVRPFLDAFDPAWRAFSRRNAKSGRW